MARPSTLKNLVALAQKKVDDAAKNLAALNASEQEAEHKLCLLLTYREDYYTRFQKSAGNGIDQIAWRNFHAFMAKLDAAIAEQRKAVMNSKHGARTGRSKWQAEQRRLKSYDTLVQRHQRAETKRAARLEQREQDEHAAKVGFSNKASA
ncbi:MAG: flagellar export protein FliJ [Burkholderiales bacterium]|nr:flagellar export protein FliJ [Burkholderiales bacterium]